MNARLSILMGLAFGALACGGSKGETETKSAVDSKSAVSIQDGEVLIERGELEAAGQVFEQILAQSPDNAEAHYYLGFVKNHLGDNKGAEFHYKKALEIDDNLQPALNNLGLMLLERADYAAAEELLKKYLDLRPEGSDAHFNYALVLEATGNTDEAEKHYRTAAELDPEDPAPWLGLGDVARKRGDNDTALKNYRQGRQLDPEMASLALAEGMLLKELKKNDEAVSLLDSIKSMPQATPTELTQAGMLLAKLGADAQAIATYQTALQKNNTSGTIHFLLANSLARTKQYNLAIPHYESFISLSPNSPEAGVAKKRLEACRQAQQ